MRGGACEGEGEGECECEDMCEYEPRVAAGREVLRGGACACESEGESEGECEGEARAAAGRLW